MCERRKEGRVVNEEVLQKFLERAIPAMARSSFDLYIRYDDRFLNNPKECIQRYLDDLNFLLNITDKPAYFVMSFSKLSPQTKDKVTDYLRAEINKWSAELQKIS